MGSIRNIIVFFIVALVLSGVTAFPIEWGLSVLIEFINWLPFEINLFSWIREVQRGVIRSYEIAPYIAYGTDWLAFAHIVIATAFIGPLIDPIKNKWIIQWGMIACCMVFPLAVIAGHIRGIPMLWQIMDCCFAIFGLVTLRIVWYKIRRLEKTKAGIYF